MKTFKWDKVTATDKYFNIPNSSIKELLGNQDALALLVAILTNASGYFTKEKLCNELRWSFTNVRKWTGAIKFLKEKGYASEDGDMFSNIPKYKKKDKPAEPTKEHETEKKVNLIIDESNITTMTVEELNIQLGAGYNDDVELPF